MALPTLLILMTSCWLLQCCSALEMQAPPMPGSSSNNLGPSQSSDITCKYGSSLRHIRILAQIAGARHLVTCQFAAWTALRHLLCRSYHKATKQTNPRRDSWQMAPLEHLCRRKRGVGYGFHNTAQLRALSGISWWYDWGKGKREEIVNMSQTLGIEYVPMQVRSDLRRCHRSTAAPLRVLCLRPRRIWLTAVGRMGQQVPEPRQPGSSLAAPAGVQRAKPQTSGCAHAGESSGACLAQQMAAFLPVHLLAR